MNSAIPIAIGTAISMASSEMTTVTQSRSSTPNRSVAPSTLHSRENRKLTWSSAIAGIARATKKIATSRISRTMNSPDPVVRTAKTRSPIRLRPRPPETDPAPKTAGSPSNVPMAVGSR